MTVSIADLKKRMKELTYPGGQYFDVETFKPEGEAEKRVELAKRNMPELIAGGKSLLDIGSSKGFISFYYRKAYECVVGYEIFDKVHQFSQDVKKHNNIENVFFVHGGMRDILLHRSICDSCSHIKWKELLGGSNQKYDVVYCGSVNHHFYRDAIKYGAPPFLFLKKLMALCNKHLIIDGPFDMTAGSLQVFSKQGKWSEQQKNDFTFENHVRHLLPQFELVRVNSNEKYRQTAVFKRVQPDINYIEHDEVDKYIKNDGVVVECNSARPKGSVWNIGNKMRVKFDKGLITDGQFLILNGLPEYFVKTLNVIIKDGKRIGDISEWVSGRELENPDDFYKHFVKMNRALSAVGQLEPHFKITDYKKHNGSYVDVDLDMIAHSAVHSDDYINRWLKTKIEYLPKRKEEFKRIAENWSSEHIYHELGRKI